MEFFEKLVAIQTDLKAPKDKVNKFSNFKYRSCEGILEAVKPLLAKHALYLNISDDIVQIGDRYYVKAKATITDGTNAQTAIAWAREEDGKKGMDAAQLTGATSSYARKYALNALFGIDDAKDPDTDEFQKQTRSSKKEKASASPKNRCSTRSKASTRRSRTLSRMSLRKCSWISGSHSSSTLKEEKQHDGLERLH